MRNLIMWAFRLASSARHRESDAGACMIKVVFSIYGLREAWKVPLPSNATDLTDLSDLASTIDGSSAHRGSR